MPASRNYSSTAGLMHLVGGVTGAAASLIVDTVTGLPTVPFTLMLDPGVSTEEIVEVTAAGGTTLTVTRGVDCTSAPAHLNGGEVRHAYSARDFQDSRNHEANTTTAHGVAGVVVGTTNTQVLTGKSLDGATNTFTNLPKVALPADATYNDTAQTLTNKTLTAPVLTAATAAGTTTVTPLTVTMPASSTADAVSVVLPAPPPSAGPAADAKVQVAARGNVTIKAMNDLTAATDVAALSVQGGRDGSTYRDIQRWVGGDSTNTTLAKIDKDGNLTAPNVPFASAAGTGTFTGTGGGTGGGLAWDNAVTITFPIGRFTVPPIVTVTGLVVVGVSWPWVSGAPTAANFTCSGLRIGAALPSGTFQWHAVQMTSTTAAG